MTRVGFVGAGLIAFYHALMLDSCDEPHEISAVHDVDPERAEGFRNWKGATVCESLDELLDRSDAVFVCTWTAAHRDAVLAAAARGMPVFCEKPLATDLAGVDELCRGGAGRGRAEHGRPRAPFLARAVDPARADP